jgi:hypothetical protein
LAELCTQCSNLIEDDKKVYKINETIINLHEKCVGEYFLVIQKCQYCLQSLESLFFGTRCAQCYVKSELCRWCEKTIIGTEHKKLVFSGTEVLLHRGDCTTDYCLRIKQCRWCSCDLDDFDGSACANCCEIQKACRWCKCAIDDKSILIHVDGGVVYLHVEGCKENYYKSRRLCYKYGCSNRAYDHYYCVRHICNIEGCEEKCINGAIVCEEHYILNKCIIKGCENARVNGISHCNEHYMYLVVPNTYGCPTPSGFPAQQYRV